MHVFSSHARFQRHDRVGSRLAIGETCKRQHFRDVLDVRVTIGLRFIVFQEVKLAIRQAKPTLPGVHHVGVGVLEVDILGEGERHAEAKLVRLRKIDRQIVAVGQRVNFFEFSGHRRGTQLIASFRVHVRREQIANLLLVTAFREIAGRGFLDDAANVLLRFLVKHEANAVTRFVGRNVRFIDPGAIDEDVKIVTGTDCGIHVFEEQPGVRRRPGRSSPGGFGGGILTTAGRQCENKGRYDQESVHRLGAPEKLWVGRQAAYSDQIAAELLGRLCIFRQGIWAGL